MEDINLLTLTSFRYCLGRRTYIASWYVDWFIKNNIQDELYDHQIKIIINEIKDADLGDVCDKQKWLELKNFLVEKIEGD